MQLGSSGDGVTCLQDSLAASGLYEGAGHGEFDEATMRAVVELQRQNDLYVDGIVGRETAIALNIWPDEESLVERTPIPPDGATDLWGVKLSPVGSTGAGAPPLPENSGSGYRVVYDRAGQRVWAVDGEERIVRSWLVSGSSYGNEQPGTHTVYSRSELSTAWNGKAYLPLMIRYQKTELGNIGFHGIPTHVNDGTVYQTTEELGHPALGWMPATAQPRRRVSVGFRRRGDEDRRHLKVGAPVAFPGAVSGISPALRAAETRFGPLAGDIPLAMATVADGFWLSSAIARR